VVKRMDDTHGITLAYADSVIDHIVGRCLVQETGARVLIGFIEQHVLPRLSALWFDAFSTKQPLARIEINVDTIGHEEQGSLVFHSITKSASLQDAPIG
jgi:type VI secretion system protein VasG